MKLNPRQQKAKDRHMQRKYAKDLIQPSEDKFKHWYPKQYNEMEQAREQQDLKANQEKQSKDEFFKKYKTRVHSKEMRNMLKIEEQLEHDKR